jgi:hypothetical protein
MIDALIKCVSVTYKCYEMYPVSASGKKGTTARVLRSIKKWTPSYYLSALFTEFAESSLNQYNNALISYFL